MTLWIASIFLMTLNVINVPVAIMRAQPNDNAEVVSQAILSEKIRVLEESGNWVKIETVVDSYQGWSKKEALCQQHNLTLNGSKPIIAKVNRCIAHLYHVADIIYGPLLSLPFESRLTVLQDIDSKWLKVALPDGREGFIQKGDVELNPLTISREALIPFSKRFLGIPYTWGGRSSFGYDCSGFVQMLYRQIGVFIPRDSKDQFQWEGFEPIAIEAMVPGDLIYFGYAEDAIRHAALYLGNGEFIHASARENMPYLRISRLTDAEWNGLGIYPSYTYRAARRLKY
jgi:gamma-D-glutamyl-L-lysine dipeptidyl-peptidase